MTTIVGLIYWVTTGRALGDKVDDAPFRGHTV